MRRVQSALIYGLILFLIPLAVLIPIAFGEEIQLPENLKPSMEHLLSMVGAAADATVDQGLVTPLLKFVETPKQMQGTLSMGMRNGAVSNYYEFTIARPFSEVIDLNYHPDIPSYITNPSSVRRTQWVEIDGEQKSLPRLAGEFDSLSRPKIFKAVEFVENTPDTFSGAYYAYELDRTLILMNHQGRRILFSISRQRDKSTVGKKGLVVGEDDEWNYLYTGEKGCTRAGLGWVKSYMYRSESIMVYYESTDPVPQVKCAMFKWLHAGWAGINMVQPLHIRKGVERFAKTFKAVIEAPVLPAADRLAEAFRQIKDLSTETLRQKARDHFALLKAKFQNDGKAKKKWFNKIFKDELYVQELAREELQALISKAYLKFVLGKEQGIDISSLTPTKRPG